MRPEFISVVYFEGRLLAFEKYGDVYEYRPNGSWPSWSLLSASPWPERTPNTTVAKLETE